MLDFEDARDLIIANVEPLGRERVHILASFGRVLGEDISAPWDMPQKDNSAMDGYAVLASDCAGIVTLPVAGYRPAGASGVSTGKAGCAYKIGTGAPIPGGCDAVVPVEEVEVSGKSVRITGPVRQGAHIRYRGEDVKRGTRVISAGSVIRPPEISMIASCGRAIVSVFRRPRVAIISTGDELIEVGESPTGGKIINSNSHSIAAAVSECGARAVNLGIAPDDEDSIREKMREGFRADALITSAGVSVGERDLVRKILDDLRVDHLFWKANIKPGKPIAFGVKEGKPVFSLPGNPVSALVTFEEFVRPALLKMSGRRDFTKPLVKATLREPIRKKPGRVEFLRVTVDVEDGEYFIRVSGDQQSGILRTLVLANGLAYLPADRTSFDKGEKVGVHLLY